MRIEPDGKAYIIVREDETLRVIEGADAATTKKKK
jgi:hypothetical protein